MAAFFDNLPNWTAVVDLCDFPQTIYLSYDYPKFTHAGLNYDCAVCGVDKNVDCVFFIRITQWDRVWCTHIGLYLYLDRAAKELSENDLARPQPSTVAVQSMTVIWNTAVCWLSPDRLWSHGLPRSGSSFFGCGMDFPPYRTEFKQETKPTTLTRRCWRIDNYINRGAKMQI
jgi:hypothetical protein